MHARGQIRWREHIFLPSVVVAQEKTASFPQSVFSNCAVHDSVNIILNNQNPW